MFAILHDNMTNARDTNQAVNGSLSIFLCVPFLELMMQCFGQVLCFFHRMCDWPTLHKGAICRTVYNVSLATECVKLLDCVYSFQFIFIENISVVKPTNLSGFVSRLYAEQWIFTPHPPYLLGCKSTKCVLLLPNGKILFQICPRPS